MVQIISGQGRSADSLKFAIRDGLANCTAVCCPSRLNSRDRIFNLAQFIVRERLCL